MDGRARAGRAAPQRIRKGTGGQSRIVRILAVACTVGSAWAPRSAAEPFRQILSDPAHDTVARPAAPLPSDTFDRTTHRLPDLRELTVGRWAPKAADTDLFMGAYDPQGPFLRLDFSLTGLMNPPGPVLPDQFAPFRYGAHPVYGFVEIDMDRDVNTGGEIFAPEYRYLGNAARFGGRPSAQRFAQRIAVDATAFDQRFTTPPYVERHGEEFHLALLGDPMGPEDITVVRGNGDFHFERGEVWDLRGRFFHRAHGFEPFSFAKGASRSGEYAAVSDLRFRHNPETEMTYLSLVFPLTNVGAGLMRGEAPEGLNSNCADHASIHEGLSDLKLSAKFINTFPTEKEEEDLILGWDDADDPLNHLDPTTWTVTAILGTSFLEPFPQGVFFVWSDALPNVLVGDFDGSGSVGEADFDLLRSFIARFDAADGVVDESVEIGDFAFDFSMFDVNYDGRVDLSDLRRIQASADADQDGDVDLRDYAGYQHCFARDEAVSDACAAADLNRDHHVDLRDVVLFRGKLTGPTASSGPTLDQAPNVD